MNTGHCTSIYSNMYAMLFLMHSAFIESILTINLNIKQKKAFLNMYRV